MRKFLWVVAVGALMLAVAAPVMAVDFKFGAEYRFRFYDYTNLGFSTVQGTNPRGIQTRLRPRFDVSDDNGNIQATWRAEFGDTQWGGGGGANSTPLGVTSSGGAFTSYRVVGLNNRVGNGAGGGAGADGVALETKWAYIDFAMPFNVPLRVRVGQQPWYLPKGLITDDDYSGVKAYGSVAPVTYEVAWFRLNRGTTVTATPASGGAAAQGFSDTKDNAFDFYEAKVDLAIHKLINPYIYGLYGDNRSNCTGNTNGIFTDSAAGCAANSRVRTQYYIGAGVTGDATVLSYDLDFIYGYAKGGPDGNLYSAVDGSPINVRGWVLDGGVHIPIGPVKLNLVGSYATGDKQDTSGHKSDAFPGGPGPSWSGPSQVAGGPYEIVGEGGMFDIVSVNSAPTGLWTIGASAEYLPVKALTLRLAYLLAGFADKKSNCALVVAGSIGCFGPGFEGTDYNSATGTGGLAGKSTLGNEIDIRADYTIWTGFKIQALTAWLIPDTGETTGKYILQFYYNF